MFKLFGRNISRYNKTSIKKQETKPNLPNLENNFNFEDNWDNNYCVYFRHKNNGSLLESDINFHLSLVKYKNESSRVALAMLYDFRNDGVISDVLINNYSLDGYDEETGMNYFGKCANEKYIVESYCAIIPKVESRKHFVFNIESFVIKFQDSTDIVLLNEEIHRAYIETYDFGLQLNRKM